MKLLLRGMSVLIMLISLGQLFGQTPSRGSAPLLHTHWGQGCLYNASCPTDTASHETCFHTPAGQGAIAMAQIMKYYEYPAHGTGEHGYPHPKYGIQYANFGTTSYNWSNMPDSLVTGNDDLSALIYQCGVAQNMNYGATNSTSTPNDLDSALVKYFNYPKTAIWKSKSDYSGPEWTAMLKAELDASHPLLYMGYDLQGRPCYFICDGYQPGDLFHFNWGFAGVDNGYLSTDSLMLGPHGFLLSQQALFNLAPSPPGPGSYIMDFENVADFSLTFNNWTVKDVDQHGTYGITNYSFPQQTEPMAFLCFNPAQVNPSMAAFTAIQPHSGQRFGACFSSNPPSNNDWFISPQIQLGTNGSFSFWVKSYSDQWGLDSYTVAVSTSENNPADFSIISGAQPLRTTTSWAKKTFNLSAFNNQKVYVAINCVSDDNYLMMIDDLEVQPTASSTLSADFAASKTSLRAGESVSFTDQSAGVPATWSWSFPGGSPSTSNLQNPAGVTYHSLGTFPVSLKVSNGLVSDSLTKTAFISVTGYPSAITLDFDSIADFSLGFNPWTVFDMRSGDTYGFNGVAFPHNFQPMAYICFVPSKTVPPLTNMQPHSGQKLGCSFATIPPMNPNDKWLISPKLSLGIYPQIDFWVQTYDVLYGYEKYNVAVSVSDLNPNSFIPVNDTIESAPSAWTKRSYDLSDYANQDVYVGIQCVSDNSFIFMIDDIFITSTVGISDKKPLDQIIIYPNPVKDYLILHSPGTGASLLQVTLFSLLGKKISSWEDVPESGRTMLDVRRIPNGLYLLRVRCGNDEVTRKVFINN